MEAPENESQSITEVYEDSLVGRLRELRKFVADSLDYFAAIETPEDISQRRDLEKNEEKAKNKVIALMEAIADRGKEWIKEAK